MLCVFIKERSSSSIGKIEPISPVSPVPMEPDLDLVPSRLSKEELIQNMDRVDREITMVEQQICKLRKKQVTFTPAILNLRYLKWLSLLLNPSIKDPRMHFHLFQKSWPSKISTRTVYKVFYLDEHKDFFLSTAFRAAISRCFSSTVQLVLCNLDTRV